VVAAAIAVSTLWQRSASLKRGEMVRQARRSPRAGAGTRLVSRARMPCTTANSTLPWPGRRTWPRRCSPSAQTRTCSRV
jgi:hypothetical protein